MKVEQNHQQKYDLCKNHMHSYVLAEMVDGTKVDGIITGLDEEYVYFAVPIDQEQQTSNRSSHRQFGFGGPSYGYGGYGHGYGSGYGHGYDQGYGHRPRRFRRLILPLTALAALSILPWY